MPRFHHVNLGVPVDGVAEEGAWLVDVLGYRRLDPGEELAAMGACWYEADDGSQVHLSGDEEHRPAARAHVAVLFDDLDPVRRRMTDRGERFTLSERDDLTVLFCRDPAGNRWELRQQAS
jgi:catechol 2,3-dioxygenase-like lactoylglutathione lyase family enzyme